MRKFRFSLLVAVICLGYITFRYIYIIRVTGFRPSPNYIERIPVDDFLLKELQVGMSLSKSNSLVIYEIENQYVEVSFALHNQPNGDSRLSVQLQPNGEDGDLSKKKSRAANIPNAIAQQTERAMEYLLSRNLLPHDPTKSHRLKDYDGYWIFYRFEGNAAVAGIAHKSKFHSGYDTQQFRDILEQFRIIAFGRFDEANLALTALDLSTARTIQAFNSEKQDLGTALHNAVSIMLKNSGISFAPGLAPGI